MANEPFDRTVINGLERPLADDINQLQSTSDRGLRLLLSQLTPGLPTGIGFIGSSFKVVPSSPASGAVVMVPGIGVYDNLADTVSAINGIIGLDDRSRTKPILLGSELSIPVQAPPGSNSRIDLIEVRYRRAVADPSSRDVFDATTGVFTPGLVNKTLTFALTSADFSVNGSGPINYKTGLAGASPSPPSTDAGYIAVATVRVAAGSTAYDADVITDERPLGFPGGSISAFMSLKIEGAPATTITLASRSSERVVPVYMVPTPFGGHVAGQYDFYALGNFQGVALSALGGGGTNIIPSALAFPSFTGLTTITSTDQTHLLDASCLPAPAKVAIGQKCAKFQISVASSAAAAPSFSPGNYGSINVIAALS